MSGGSRRRFHPVAIEPSASALLAAPSASRSPDTAQPLPSYVALNFNFKPDSTHDCRKGALFQPTSGRNSNADWQLELESTEDPPDAGPSAGPDDNGSKKPAHIFTGPQIAAKTYDVVLVWDEKEKVYRMDRIASSFALKYERSKTVLSSTSQDAWKGGAGRPKKRSIGDSIASQRAPAASSSTVPRTAGQGELKLRSKTSSAATPVRRSSRRGLAVEMEEFESPSRASADDTEPACANVSKRRSPSPDRKPPVAEESKRVKSTASSTERGSTDEVAGGLRRSRRRSSQTQTDDSSAAAKSDPPGSADGEDDGLALELERELERELEVEVQDVAEVEEPMPPSDPSHTTSKPTSTRTLSPVSRLKKAERGLKIDTPKAHTPDPALPSASTSPSSPRFAPAATDSSASIGLGLHSTGVGITPTSSPHLDLASPKSMSKAIPDEEEEEDDGLDDFAAELDMSLAEVPAAQPVEKRRSSRAQGVPRVERKAYGLGGPRQEEEELEDSD